MRMCSPIEEHIIGEHILVRKHNSRRKHIPEREHNPIENTVSYVANETLLMTSNTLATH
jgi:hypothetical protein